MVSISIYELEKELKKVLGDSSIQFVESVYEKMEGGYKLVINLKNLFFKSTNIFYTKLIFYVDKNKTYMLPGDDDEYKFRYLFDINCHYKLHIFDNLDEFSNILKKIIKKDIFGDNIKILSEFIKSPGSLINNWFNENNVRNISVYNVKLDPRYETIPCKKLFFNFIINLNNQIEINLVIKKENKTNYIYNFKIHDETFTYEKPNLSTLVETIGSTLKNKYV